MDPTPIIQWRIYRQPEDYPDNFVVVKWEIDPIEGVISYSAKPHAVVGSLSEARATLPEGLARCQLYQSDNRHKVVEVWM
jgi:hypothetical protein